jgi:hypothetical protein
VTGPDAISPPVAVLLLALVLALATAGWRYALPFGATGGLFLLSLLAALAAVVRLGMPP